MKHLALQIIAAVAVSFLGGRPLARNRRPFTDASVARLPSQR